MLSIELGRRGIESLLIDAKDGTAVNPQANATQARTMEHFRRLGLADPQRRSRLAAVDGVDEFAFHTQIRAGKTSMSTTREPAIWWPSRSLARWTSRSSRWTRGSPVMRWSPSASDRGASSSPSTAHLFTPASGLGYTTAVEDAVNLGWKLASAFDGSGGPAPDRRMRFVIEALVATCTRPCARWSRPMPSGSGASIS